MKLDKFWRKKRFYLFSKVILAVSKVRHLPHLPPLRHGHVGQRRLVWVVYHVESGYYLRWVIVRGGVVKSLWKQKKANRYHSDMDNDRVQTYRRIVSTMFNDGVINMGRVLVLFAFTSPMGQQYTTDAWKFRDIYHTVLKGDRIRILRSLINQSE